MPVSLRNLHARARAILALAVLCWPLAAPQHALLVIGFATFFFSSLGGIAEEARFTIQLLPLYAALPVCSRYAVRQGSRP